MSNIQTMRYKLKHISKKLEHPLEIAVLCKSDFEVVVKVKSRQDSLSHEKK